LTRTVDKPPVDQLMFSFRPCVRPSASLRNLRRAQLFHPVMDRPAPPSDNLRAPFIATANALAALYKSAAAAERDARTTGERAAFMEVLSWAVARRDPLAARGGGDHLSELVAFATERLAAMPPPAPAATLAFTPAPGPAPTMGPTQQPQQRPSQMQTQPRITPQPSTPQRERDRERGTSGGDSLASGLGKLLVNPNPRKRPRVDLGDTFLNDVWRQEGLEEDSPFSPALHSPVQTPEHSNYIFAPSAPPPAGSAAAARKLSLSSKKPGRDPRSSAPSRRRED
jgi:hypothetical protein